MGCDVYANSNEVACKAGDGKVIAAFPDVCLSPPSPPAGPIPLPYPNSSFSKDMKAGSKTVKIKSKEVMLKDKSFYKTSPLGNEAATRGLGAGVVSHVITGKTYFTSWSMDVKVEGENVDRHIDMTTSNHASLVPNESIPWANMSSQQIADWEDATGLCACCNQTQHPGRQGAPVVSEDDFYGLNEVINEPNAAMQQQRERERNNRQRWVAEARRKGCLAPKPCNVYRILNQPQRAAMRREANAHAPDYQNEKMVLFVQADRQEVPDGTIIKHERHATINHLTPIAAGGCPVGDNNLKADKAKDKSAQLSAQCEESVKQLDGIANEVTQRRANGTLA